jgi:hypothetical protein
MSNTNFVVDTGITVGNIVLDAASGNVTIPGNLTLTSTGTLGYGDGATAIVPKAYVDTMSIVFGI